LWQKIAQTILETEKEGNKNLSIALVGQGRIRELNKKYRGKNRATDVLAFPGNGLGEIVICLREVKKNAKRFGSIFKKELARVLIHGILHLLGYNHERSKTETKKMEEKQNYYLEILSRSHGL
jgi:probable rRNA maturation factor